MLERKSLPVQKKSDYDDDKVKQLSDLYTFKVETSNDALHFFYNSNNDSPNKTLTGEMGEIQTRWDVNFFL